MKSKKSDERVWQSVRDLLLNTEIRPQLNDDDDDADAEQNDEDDKEQKGPARFVRPARVLSNKKCVN